MSNTNYFPLDIESAKAYGIKEWQKEFFWPLPYEHFIKTEVKIRKMLNEFIRENAGNCISDLLLINYKLFIEYNNLINSLRVINELGKRKLKPMYDDNSINFKGMIEDALGDGIKRVYDSELSIKSKLRFLRQ